MTGVPGLGLLGEVKEETVKLWPSRSNFLLAPTLFVRLLRNLFLVMYMGDCW